MLWFLRVPGLTALGRVCFIFLEKRGRIFAVVVGLSGDRAGIAISDVDVKVICLMPDELTVEVFGKVERNAVDASDDLPSDFV